MEIKKRILLIINPVSGRREVLNKLSQVIDKFCKNGCLPTVAFTQKRGDAHRLAQTCPPDYDAVVCAGGDGTLNEVIGGLMAGGVNLPLGYLPVGTTNDLANSLGIPKNVLSAVDLILNSTPVLLDIGSFSGRYFNYVASFGAFTEASYNAPQEVKNILGHAAYILEGIKSLGSIRRCRVRFEFNGQQLEGDYIFGAVTNTTSLGGLIKLKQHLIALNDGVFELLLIRYPENLQQLNKIIGDLLAQNFSGEYIKMYHTAKIKVTASGEMNWTLDGEKQPGAPEILIENIPHAIRFFAATPNANKNKQ